MKHSEKLWLAAMVVVAPHVTTGVALLLGAMFFGFAVYAELQE